MNAAPSALRTVLLAAVEPSAASDQVIHTAAALSRIIPGAELHFLHVIDPGPPPHELVISLTDLMAEGRKFIDGVVTTAAQGSSCRIVAHLAVGQPVERILQIATDLSADLVVVGTHERRGLARVLGSVSEKVLAHASCAVLVARPKEAGPLTPPIEPPCPDCVAVQRETHGETLWCDRHAKRHVHGHLHYSTGSGFGQGAMFVR